jgi:hypothetical protein
MRLQPVHLPMQGNGAQLRISLVLRPFYKPVLSVAKRSRRAQDRFRRFAPTLSMSGGFLRFS